MERAELRKFGRSSQQEPTPGVVDLQLVRLARGVGVLAVLRLADDPPERDFLTGPVGRPIGVNISARGEPLGHLVGHAEARAGRVAAVEHEILESGVGSRRRVRGDRRAGKGGARQRLVPVRQKDAVVAGLLLEDHARAVGDQDASPLATLARLHVLGEDEHLLARDLDDGVEVAADDQGRGLEVLLVGHLDDVDAGHGDLEVIRRLDRLELRVCLDGHRPLGIRRDQADVERGDLAQHVLLAEVGLGVQLVGGEGQVLEVPGRDLEVGRLARAEGPGGDDGQGLGLHHGDPLVGLRLPGVGGHLAESLDGPGRVALLGLEDRGDVELGVRGGLGAGELADQGVPGGDRLVVFLLRLEALADLEEHLGHPGVERVLADEGLPGAAGVGILLEGQGVGGDLELGVEDRPLGVGRLRAVGVLGEVAAIGGDGVVELPLALQGLGDLERGGHGQVGEVAFGLIRLGPVGVSLEEGPEGLDGGLGLARPPVQVRLADLVRGSDGLRVRRGDGQEPAEGGDPEVELANVGRGGDAVGPGDLPEAARSL